MSCKNIINEITDQYPYRVEFWFIKIEDGLSENNLSVYYFFRGGMSSPEIIGDFQDDLILSEYLNINVLERMRNLPFLKLETYNKETKREDCRLIGVYEL